ncbi:MAG TPA: DUF4214 domain-containing protein [Gemmataceae bacterium]|nr:DUF4214 domain-containing protein [Gemmataceae bacterium]
MSAIRSPRPLRYRPQVEHLESREVLSTAYDPTAVEQVFLERLNDARANPAAYGASIGLDLSGVAASQPLAFDLRLMQSSLLHSQDMNAQNYFGHTDPSGAGPGDRIVAAGFPATSWRESIAAGYQTPDAALRALIIDQGQSDLGHRRHLLAIDATFRGQNLVGIGIVQNGSGSYQNYYTIDTGSLADTRPYLTGVVYNDTNHNNLYDAGEGLGGVTVMVQGVGSTTTFGSGAYNLQLDPGTYTVTFNGGGLAAPIARTVSVGAINYRLTITADSATASQPGTPAASTTPSTTVSATLPATDSTPTTDSTKPAVAPWPTPPSDPNQAWLFNLYQGLLNRTPGAGDYSFWLGTLQQGATRADVTAAIMQSPEYHFKEGSKWLPEIYQTLLNRAPGPKDFSYWLNVLGNGASHSEVVANIVMSQEYQQGTGGQPAVWLDKVYQHLLFRHTGPVDQAYWLGVIAGGASYVDVALQMMQSTESHLAEDRRWLTQLYRDILGREATSNDLTTWLTAIQAGATRSGIVAVVLGSPEFQQRVSG